MCIKEVLDGRGTNETTERGGVHIKKDRAKTEPCGTPQVRGSEGERLGGMKQLICGNDKYEVNHFSGSLEMPNLVERRRSKMEWLRVSKAAER